MKFITKQAPGIVLSVLVSALAPLCVVAGGSVASEHTAKQDQLSVPVAYLPKKEDRLPQTDPPLREVAISVSAPPALQPTDWRPPFGAPGQQIPGPPLGVPPPPRLFDLAALPLLPAPPPGASGPLTSRAACEDQLNRAAGMAAYLKSELRLRTDQNDVWLKLEQAAEPALQELHAVCDKLPTEPSPPATLLEAIEIAEQSTSAQLNFFRVIRDPLRAFYETLSPEQRQMLQPPKPLPPL